MRIFRPRLPSAASLLAFAALAPATTKGLNQIVTPDVQPYGQLSLSLQAQHMSLGNAYQAQYELGITGNFELSAAQGFRPGEAFLASELGIIQQKNWLVSTGFLGWSTRGDSPQPFVEAGYYKDKIKTMAGIQRVGRLNQALLGAAYQATPVLLLQADFLSGAPNFLTLGFTYSPAPNLSINPSIYRENAPGHHLLPYLVVSWTVTAFK